VTSDDLTLCYAYIHYQKIMDANDGDLIKVWTFF